MKKTKWNINLYYGLTAAVTSRRNQNHPSAKIKGILQGLNMKRINDDVYSGEVEVIDHLKAAGQLGKVLELLAKPETTSEPRFLVLTIHAIPAAP